MNGKRSVTAGERHARMASRLERVRRALLRPLCTPSFVAGASWVAVMGAQGAGWRSATHLWVSLLSRLAMIATLLSPVCVAVAVVLSAVSSSHRPPREVRTGWMVIVAALGCTGFALASLARHMAEL